MMRTNGEDYLKDINLLRVSTVKRYTLYLTNPQIQVCEPQQNSNIEIFLAQFHIILSKNKLSHKC